MRLVAVYDPKGRAEALETRFKAMRRVFGAGWRAEELDGREAASDPAARVLRLAALVPEGADPAGRILRKGGRLIAGRARLFGGEAGDDLARLGRAEAAGAFGRLSVGPAPVEGDFGALTLDPRAGRLVLLRDAMGRAPLLFARLADGVVAVADWIHALRALPEIAGGPDRERLETWLAFRRLPRGMTLWPGIEEVAPGERVEIGAEGGARARWWAPGPDPALAGLGDGEILEAAQERARAAVLERAGRVGARPAVLFSGGLDSSLVAGLMCSADPGAEVAAFATASAEGKAETERAAREAMRRRWPNLRVEEVGPEGLDPLEGAETWWRRHAAPNPDWTAYTSLALARRAAAAGHDALMGGMAGDRLVSAELRAKLHEDLVLGRLGQAGAEMRALRGAGLGWRAILSLGVVKPNALFDLWRRFRPGPEVTRGLPFAPDRARRERWLAEGLVPWNRVPRRVLEEERGNLESCPPWILEDAAFFEAAPGEMEAPPAALAYGAPLADTRLTSAVMAAPARLKTRGGLHRGVMRALLEDVAPPEIVGRRDKSAFQPDHARLAREAAPRIREALGRFAELELWREIVSRRRVEASLARLEGGGAFRVSDVVRAKHAWFLGAFLERAEARDGGTG